MCGDVIRELHKDVGPQRRRRDPDNIEKHPGSVAERIGWMMCSLVVILVDASGHIVIIVTMTDWMLIRMH